VTYISASFEVFTAVMFQVEVWVMTTCSFVVGYQRFGGPCCLHLHGRVAGVRLRVRVRVIILLTVSQSISLGFEPLLGLMAIRLLHKRVFDFVFRGVSSVTGGRVCHAKSQNPCLCHMYTSFLKMFIWAGQEIPSPFMELGGSLQCSLESAAELSHINPVMILPYSLSLTDPF